MGNSGVPHKGGAPTFLKLQGPDRETQNLYLKLLSFSLLINQRSTVDILPKEQSWFDWFHWNGDNVYNLHCFNLCHQYRILRLIHHHKKSRKNIFPPVVLIRRVSAVLSRKVKPPTIHLLPRKSIFIQY